VRARGILHPMIPKHFSVIKWPFRTINELKILGMMNYGSYSLAHTFRQIMGLWRPRSMADGPSGKAAVNERLQRTPMGQFAISYRMRLWNNQCTWDAGDAGSLAHQPTHHFR
jgi:hypothetical protein